MSTANFRKEETETVLKLVLTKLIFLSRCLLTWRAFVILSFHMVKWCFNWLNIFFTGAELVKESDEIDLEGIDDEEIDKVSRLFQHWLLHFFHAGLEDTINLKDIDSFLKYEIMNGLTILCEKFHSFGGLRESLGKKLKRREVGRGKSVSFSKKNVSVNTVVSVLTRMHRETTPNEGAQRE